jgi:hypothetical protein
MNLEIGTEAAQFPEKEYINGIFVAVTYIEDLSLTPLLFSLIVTKLHFSVLTSSSSSCPSFIQNAMFSVFAISSRTLLTKLLRTASPLGCKSAHLQHKPSTEKNVNMYKIHPVGNEYIMNVEVHIKKC